MLDGFCFMLAYSPWNRYIAESPQPSIEIIDDHWPNLVLIASSRGSLINLPIRLGKAITTISSNGTSRLRNVDDIFYHPKIIAPKSKPAALTSNPMNRSPIARNFHISSLASPLVSILLPLI